jgi:hypothetical protein
VGAQPQNTISRQETKARIGFLNTAFPGLKLSLFFCAFLIEINSKNKFHDKKTRQRRKKKTQERSKATDTNSPHL